jgi:hypothetical protein
MPRARSLGIFVFDDRRIEHLHGQLADGLADSAFVTLPDIPGSVLETWEITNSMRGLSAWTKSVIGRNPFAGGGLHQLCIS